MKYEQTANAAFYAVDSSEGTWNTGREELPNLGYKPRAKEGYFPVPPSDSQNDIRNEMVLVLQEELGQQTQLMEHPQHELEEVVVVQQVEIQRVQVELEAVELVVQDLQMEILVL